MLRRVLVCVLAVAALANSASAALLIRASAEDPGLDLSMVLPGQSFSVLVTAEATELTELIAGIIPGQSFSGGDWTIRTEGGVFGPAQYLASGAGTWLGDEGADFRDYTGGPDPAHIFLATGPGGAINLGRILLTAPQAVGEFSVSITDVTSFNSGFLIVSNASQGFSFSVVPEPSAALLSLVGLTGLVVRRRRSA